MNPITITITPAFLLGTTIVGIILLFSSYKFGKHVGQLEERSNRLDKLEDHEDFLPLCDEKKD